MNVNYDPKEKIYLLIHKKQFSIEEISKELYGNRNTRIYDYIKELERNKWITVKKDYSKDARKTYCFPEPKGLIDSIKGELNLKPIEVKKLEKFFSDPGFQLFLKGMIEKKQNITLDYVKANISLFAIYSNIFLNHVRKKTGYSIPTCKKIFIKHFNSDERRNLIYSTYKKNFDSISNVNLEEPNFNLMSMIYGYLDLGSDLMNKISNLGINQDLLYHLFFMTNAMNQSVNELMPKLRNKI